MPLLTGLQPPVVLPPGQFSPALFVPLTATWTPPDGTVWDLTGNNPDDPVSTRRGVAGIGPAPRTITRRALSSGGSYARWSHMEEAVVTWPVSVRVDPQYGPADDLWRRFVRAFTQTAPPAGPPSPGVLRIGRADGTWRELTCIYDAGLPEAVWASATRIDAALDLLAVDPRWYGPGANLLAFDYVTARNYYSPYLTVSPDHQLGVQQLWVDGDLPPDPVWTLAGPTSGVTIGIVGGPSFTYAQPIAAGRTVTVDIAASTVVDDAGANQIGALSWPGSELFPLPPGLSTVQIDMQSASVGSGVRSSYRPVYESA